VENFVEQEISVKAGNSSVPRDFISQESDLFMIPSVMTANPTHNILSGKNDQMPLLYIRHISVLTADYNSTQTITEARHTIIFINSDDKTAEILT
jgi:hypothetical protein